MAYKLMEAFVELTARGQARVLGALSTIQSRVDAFNARNKQLGALTAYAEQRGLKLAAEDAEKLVNVLGKGGGTAALDKWIDAQKASRKFYGDLSESFKNFRLAAATGFNEASRAAVAFTAAASPAHWQTLTGSVQLLSTALGEVFLPVIEEVIGFIQDLAFWFKSLDPATKETIATWVKWGLVLLGTVKVIGIVQSFLVALWPAVRLAALGFVGLAGAIRTAAVAMAAWAAANPASALLAVIGAVAAVVLGINAVSAALAEATASLEQFEEASERLARGGRATRRDIDIAFGGRTGELAEARQAAPGTAAFRQRWGAIATQARQEATEMNAEAMERQALAIRTVLERPLDLAAERQRRGQMSFITAEQVRRERLQEAGVSPANIERLWGAGGLGGAFVGGGLTAQQIQQATDLIRGQGGAARLRAQIAEEALRTGEVPGGRRRGPLSGATFQAQLGNIEEGWRRIQLAAAGGSELEAVTREWQAQSMDRFNRIVANTDRIPGGGAPAPGQPQQGG